LEAKFINKSLSALGNIINVLKNKHKYTLENNKNLSPSPMKS